MLDFAIAENFRLSWDDVGADVRQFGQNELRRLIQDDGFLSGLAVIEKEQPAMQINVRPLQFQDFAATGPSEDEQADGSSREMVDLDPSILCFRCVLGSFAGTQDLIKRLQTADIALVADIADSDWRGYRRTGLGAIALPRLTQSRATSVRTIEKTMSPVASAVSMSALLANSTSRAQNILLSQNFAVA